MKEQASTELAENATFSQLGSQETSLATIGYKPLMLQVQRLRQPTCHARELQLGWSGMKKCQHLYVT